MEHEIAIIMAAGMGTRLRPLTEKIPKPLLCVNGKPMVETVIDALIKRGVDRILVVVGYLGEQFTCLTKKYECVEIIKNEEFEVKNNISSLYAAKDFLGSANCFICEADLLLVDESIIADANLTYSCYYGKMKKGYSDDWVFEVSNGRITRVGKCGTDLYNMVGISYFKREDAKILREAIVSSYERPESANYFWDDVVNNNLDKLKLEIYPIAENSIFEIDTVDEFKALNNAGGCAAYLQD